MATTYDKLYQTEHLFGAPYPELLQFFAAYSEKGKVLDLGCGQGRDAIPLARLGFEVVGMDHSKVGIEQMTQIAEAEGLPLTGLVADIYDLNDFSGFDFILLDSLFHFTKKDLQRETDFIKKILANSDEGCSIVFCIQDTGKKVKILNETIDFEKPLTRLVDQGMEYVFEDKETGHRSKSSYRMIVVRQCA